MDIDKMIAEVERLDREATPGPWRVKQGEYSAPEVTSDGGWIVSQGCTDCCQYGEPSVSLDLIATYRTAAPLLAAEVKRLRAGGCARDQRTTQFCAEAVAKDAEIAKLRDRILDYQQHLHVAEQERDGWRKRHGDVTIDRDHALAMVTEANAEIARLKGTMIEPTEQTGDEDSEHGAPVCVLCGRDIDVSVPFSTGPASGPAGRILGDDDSAHGECLDHARQAVA